MFCEQFPMQEGGTSAARAIFSVTIGTAMRSSLSLAAALAGVWSGE